MNTFIPREEDSIRNRKVTYMKIDQYPSVVGLVSMCMGGANFAVLMLLFLISYTQKGESGMWIGVLGLLLAIVAISGIVTAVVGMRDEEAKKGRSVAGFCINVFLFLVYVSLYVTGIV